MAKAIMVQGTMSNAGKSLLAAGLCRIFKQDGYRVAPFKSQNMALNSFITKEGLEMGRAQVMQAEAAGIAPSVLMNPVLLKPTNDVGSQVIVNGEVLGNMSARDYFKYKKKLVPDIMKAYNALAAENDIIVIEGAGSPAEINLKSDDIVNMGMAKMAKAPVLLVGDIDRGGVFAQLIGTVMLLEEDEKEMVKGLIINKFRGDKTILDPGVEMLEESHEIKQDLLENVRAYMDGIEKVRDVRNREFTAQSSFIRAMKQEAMDLSSGTLKVQVDFDPAYYYRTLSELTGAAIDGEYQLIAAVRELSKMKKEYEQVQDALQAVRMKGYGVISPVKGEITLEEPVVIRQGNKYGVKIRSEAPSIHLIRANIETEIAPIVGSEQQANDLIAYIRENQQTEDGIWNTNIFGKSVEQLVEDGIRGKLTRIGDECQEKLQDTMQKVVNDLSGGMVCIII